MRNLPPRIRATIMAVTTSSRDFLLRDELVEDADRQSTAEILCDGILSALSFNRNHLAPLTCSRLYPDAVKRLLKISGAKEGLIEALHLAVAPTVAPIRFARCFYENVSYRTKIFTAENLRLLGTPEAYCALAAIGEINWKTAPRRARAVYALRALIAEARS